MTMIDTSGAASGEPGVDTSTTGRLGRTRAYRPWVPTPDVRRPMVVDLAASFVLALIAVQAFDPTYGGLLWLRVGAVGVVAGLVVAYLTLQLRVNPIVTVVATVVGFLAFGGVAVPTTAIAGYLPGPGTPGALFDGITHGWARLLTTIPPVGTIDNLAAIVYLGGFVAAGGAFQVARRLRSTWLPLLPAVTVLLAALLVGTDSPASTLAQGAGFAVVALVWMSLRNARIRPRVHVVGASPWRRRMVSTSFVALIVVGALGVVSVQPVAGPSERFVLRRHTEPPFDPNAFPSALAGYPEWREKAQPDSPKRTTTVLSVKGLPANVPVRVSVLDVYDGTVWLVGDDAGGPDQSGSGHFVRVGNDLGAQGRRAAGESVRRRGPTTPANIVVDPGSYADVWVPGVAGLTSLNFEGPGAATDERNLRFNKATGVAALPSGLAKGTLVESRAEVPEVSYVGSTGTEGKALRAKIVGSAPADPGVVLPAVPDLSAKGDVTIAGVAQRLAVGGSDYARAVALETALSKKGQAYFSDGIDDANSVAQFRSGHNLYQLGRFLGYENPLDKTKPLFVGNAERYAAAMAAMARTQGLPARVVVGFRANADDKVPAVRRGGATIFTPVQADAWVEIAFQGVGWVGFFPTPPRSQNDVPQTTPKKQSSKPADVKAEPPVSPPPNAATLQDRMSKRHENPRKAEAAGFHIPGWVWLALKIIFYPLILIAAIVGAITGYKRWRRNRRRTRGSPVDRVTGAWAEMMDQLRDLGTRIPRSGTRLEIAAGVTTDKWDQLPGFAAGVDAAMFGPDDPDDESVASMWEWVDTERGKLLDALDRKARWKALLNLKSLGSWR